MRIFAFTGNQLQFLNLCVELYHIISGNKIVFPISTIYMDVLYATFLYKPVEGLLREK